MASHSFVKSHSALGPYTEAVELFNTVSRGGKTNKNNNMLYTSAISHINPCLGVIFARAIFWMYRFKIMKEPFPNLLEPEEYFIRYVLRGSDDAFQGVSSSSCSTAHEAVHEKWKLFVTKILHQGRGQAHRECDEDENSIDSIRRIAHTCHSDTAESYCLNTPLGPVLTLGRFDRTVRDNVVPPHHQIQPSEELINILFIPDLEQNAIAIQQGITRCASRKEVKSARLVCANATCKAFHRLVVEFLQCSAGRKRDKNTRIQEDTHALWVTLRHTNPLLWQLDLFSSDAWLSFADAVRCSHPHPLPACFRGRLPAHTRSRPPFSHSNHPYHLHPRR